jgi:hypothetical protein
MSDEKVTPEHYTIDIEGRYEFVRHGSALVLNRFGKPWRDLAGDKAILALFQHAEKLERELGAGPMYPCSCPNPDCARHGGTAGAERARRALTLDADVAAVDAALRADEIPQSADTAVASYVEINDAYADVLRSGE